MSEERTEQASGGERELSNRPASRPVCEYCGTSCFAWVPCKERLAAEKAKQQASGGEHGLSKKVAELERKAQKADDCMCGYVRATLLVNYGPTARAGSGVLINEDMSTFTMLIEVLQHLHRNARAEQDAKSRCKEDPACEYWVVGECTVPDICPMDAKDEEIERLKGELAEYKAEPELEQLRYDGNCVMMSQSHPIFSRIVYEMADLLEQTGAENFLTMNMTKDMREYEVTIRKAGHKTPSDKLREQDRAIEKLKAEADAMREDLAKKETELNAIYDLFDEGASHDTIVNLLDEALRSVADAQVAKGVATALRDAAANYLAVVNEDAPTGDEICDEDINMTEWLTGHFGRLRSAESRLRQAISDQKPLPLSDETKKLKADIGILREALMIVADHNEYHSGDVAKDALAKAGA